MLPLPVSPAKRKLRADRIDFMLSPATKGCARAVKQDDDSDDVETELIGGTKAGRVRVETEPSPVRSAEVRIYRPPPPILNIGGKLAFDSSQGLHFRTIDLTPCGEDDISHDVRGNQHLTVKPTLSA